MTKTFSKLKNPPIKEVALDIAIDNYFSNISEIDAICVEIEKTYPNKKPSFGIKPSINVNNNKLESVSEITGYIFSNQDNTEILIIDKKRIIFVDRNKYANFENFYSKFKKVFEQINKIKPIQNPREMGLKYANVFSLEQDEVINTNPPKVNFLPNFAAFDRSPEKKKFAGLTRFAGNYMLQADNNTELIAFINTDLQFVGSPLRMQTVFVIDTLLRIKEISLDADVAKLREFKNEIFFANVDSNIKEFEK